MPADNLAAAEALPCRAAHDADVVAARDQVLDRRLRDALLDRDDDALREVRQVPARKIIADDNETLASEITLFVSRSQGSRGQRPFAQTFIF